MDELDFYDPEDLELVELGAPKRRRRKRRRNPAPTIAAATPVLLLGAAYLAWVWYNQTRFKIWNWTPWRLAGRTPRLQLRRSNPNNTEAERQERQRQAAYDAAVEKMTAPAFSVQEVDLWRAPRHDALEKEVVTFIEP